MPVDLAYAIGLPPEKAIEYFQSKGYAITWSWRDLWQEAHAKAFTVAGVTKLDVLQDIREVLASALKEGKTLAGFEKELTPLLQQKGWWGTNAQADKNTGEMTGKGLTPRRLKTIYQTNMQTAYMAGRYKAMMENAADRPYWQYVAVMDSRTRPSHRSLNGRVFRYDDPFWQSFYPPNGFNCRCRVRSLDDETMQSRGYDLSNSLGRLDQVQVPTSRRPGAQMVDVARFEYSLGEYIRPDAGWSYNPGRAAFQPELDAYDYRVARQYVNGTLTGPAFNGWYQDMASSVEAAQLAHPDLARPALQAKLTADLVTGQRYPVAVLDDVYRDLIGAQSRTVWMSDETLLKQLLNRSGQDIGLKDYWRVQGVIEQAALIVRDGARTLVFISLDGKYYQASIKSTQTGKALFLTSFRETNPDDMKRLMSKGEVVKNDL